MAEHTYNFSTDKINLYKELSLYMNGLLDGETDLIANLSNASALINLALNDIIWVGFYLMKDGELVLGPFQGNPACIRIKIGKGVCGTAVKDNEIQLVNDVSQFPGHISCDSKSKSEIVLPVHNKDGSILGVLDIDSGIFNRFDITDKKGLAQVVTIIEKNL